MQQPAHLAVRIIKISKVHAMRRAHRDARRIEGVFNTMNTEGAFVGVAVWMDKSCIIGTRRNARLASNAHGVFYEHDTAEVVDMARAGRAAIHTRWIVTMIASL